jgi:hypothetical protein
MLALPKEAAVFVNELHRSAVCCPPNETVILIMCGHRTGQIWIHK